MHGRAGSPCAQTRLPLSKRTEPCAYPYSTSCRVTTYSEPSAATTILSGLAMAGCAAPGEVRDERLSGAPAVRGAARRAAGRARVRGPLSPPARPHRGPPPRRRTRRWRRQQRLQRPVAPLAYDRAAGGVDRIRAHYEQEPPRELGEPRLAARV